MIVEHFYFGMIKADEKYVLGLMFHIFLDGKWSYELDDLKFAMSCKTKLWISDEEKLVCNIFCMISKSYRCRSLLRVNEITQLYHTNPDIHNNCSLLFHGNFV